MKLVVLLALVLLSPQRAAPYWTAQEKDHCHIPFTHYSLWWSNLGIDICYQPEHQLIQTRITLGYGYDDYFSRLDREFEIYRGEEVRGFDPILDWMARR